MNRRLRESVQRWWVLGVILLGLCPAGMAQVTTARLDGVVRDASGAVVSGAKVVATHLGTNTSSGGDQRQWTLRPREAGAGEYSVTAEQAGFKRSVHPKISLKVGDTVTLNLNLEPGEISQSVTITDTPPVVDQVSQSIGSVVKEEQIQNLPLKVASRSRSSTFRQEPTLATESRRIRAISRIKAASTGCGSPRIT